MLKLSKLTDYGVVILGKLSHGDDGLRSAGDLAGMTGVPEPTVAKTLKLASKAGLVIGQRGAAGGYRLVRDPAKISIAEVIEAFEGPIALTACVDGSTDSCAVETLCPMRHNWDTVNQAIRSALSAVTLKDMSIGTMPTGIPEMFLDPSERTTEPLVSAAE
ncbi:MAG: SUF system Fe-S cluster assembly regulator [Alphaproteobacteria bacterium]|nr:SUF system Fe-S cluster assembly regulator [Alphaproteobacteria bacterium SS10]